MVGLDRSSSTAWLERAIVNRSVKKSPLQSACAAVLEYAPLSGSRRTFLLRSGAIATAIYLSSDPSDYAKDGPVDCDASGKLYYLRRQANDCLNYGAPVYAYKQNNIAIAGEGDSSVQNGQAMTPFAGSGNASTCWWTFMGNSGAYGFVSSSTPSQATANTNNVALKIKVPGISSTLYALLTNPVTPWQQDQNYLPALPEAGVPIEQRIFGKGHYLRPRMVEFVGWACSVRLQRFASDPDRAGITRVTISDCDFGTPSAAGPASATTRGPIYAYNVHDSVLKNVQISGTIYNSTVMDARQSYRYVARCSLCT
jgi:polygalacturonase